MFSVTDIDLSFANIKIEFSERCVLKTIPWRAGYIHAGDQIGQHYVGDKMCWWQLHDVADGSVILVTNIQYLFTLASDNNFPKMSPLSKFCQQLSVTKVGLSPTLHSAKRSLFCAVWWLVISQQIGDVNLFQFATKCFQLMIMVKIRSKDGSVAFPI